MTSSGGPRQIGRRFHVPHQVFEVFAPGVLKLLFEEGQFP
jgi:hypothetical protein